MTERKPSVGRIVLVSQGPAQPPMPGIIFRVRDTTVDVRHLGMYEGITFAVELRDTDTDPGEPGVAFWPPRV